MTVTSQGPEFNLDNERRGPREEENYRKATKYIVVGSAAQAVISKVRDSQTLGDPENSKEMDSFLLS